MNNANLPAMPVPLAGGETFSGHGFADGLTKREHFAAMAMQGFCAASEFADVSVEDLTESAVLQADALLDVLEQTGGES